MYKHILLATDLSKESFQVEDKAAAVQKLTDANLSIIHIIEPLPAISDVGEGAFFADHYQTHEELAEYAKKLLKPVMKRLNISESNMVIGSGRVSHEILLYADKRDVDLIVTGSHGRHGLQHILGSTANAILHGAKCDVLSVRINNK
jgi:universal stress protein A